MSSAFTTRTTSAKDAAPASCCFAIFAGKPRSRAQKQGLYRRLCARLDDEMAVSPQDVMVVIQFNQLEDWSFSAGKMADE